MLNNFIKTYSNQNKRYQYPTMLRHEGVVLAFAMDQQRRICYTVLDLQNPDSASALDVDRWLSEPKELGFPNEIADVGFGVADQTSLPTVKKGSPETVKAGIRVLENEKDIFLSSTARFSTDAPFQVLSDGRFVYVLRQAIDVNHSDQVFQTDDQGQIVKDANGKSAPLVNSTLLLDRFVLAGTELMPKMEVRFRRSRSKIRPQSNKDSLGAKDMEDRAFFEPTQELSFLGTLTKGRFSALILPTTVMDVERWQFFVCNAETNAIDMVNVERSPDGLFNTKGTQGSNSGIQRRTLKLEGRTPQSGITSQLYYLQEPGTAGYDTADAGKKPLKQSARVMVAVATAAEGETQHRIATLDLGVAGDGTLAKAPEKLTLSVVKAELQGQTFNQQLERISGLQSDVADLNQRMVALNRKFTLQKQWLDILSALHNGSYDTSNIPTGDQNDLNIDFSDLIQAIKNFSAGTQNLSDAQLKQNTLQEPDNAKITLIQAIKNFSAGIQNLSDAQLKQNTLQAELNNARITVYEHSEYRGRSLSYGMGFVGYTTLNASDFNDRISSISLPRSLQVRVYEDANGGGDSRDILASTDNVGGEWNDRISSMGISVKASFSDLQRDAQQAITKAIAQREAARQKMLDLQSEIQTQQQENGNQGMMAAQELASKKNELASIQSSVNSGVAVPMSLIYTDAAGLSISGGLLDFAWSEDTPLLFDSATGKLALYFRGADDQFFVAYYDVLTERPRFQLQDAAGAVSAIALTRGTEAEVDNLSVVITDSDDTATCTVEIALKTDSLDLKETWEKMPRDPAAFVRVINGLASDRPFVGQGTLTAGDADYTLQLPKGVRRTLPAGTLLLLGQAKVSLKQSVSKGATSVTVTSHSVNLPTDEQPAFLLEYDYDNASSQAGADLTNGSLMLGVAATGTGKAIASQELNTKPENRIQTISCRWIADAPGYTLSFDGKTTAAGPIAPTDDALTRFAAKGDLTLEAWIKPGEMPTQGQVIQHKSADSRYGLGLKRVAMQSARRFQGTLDFIRIPNSDALNFSGAITLEAWVKPELMSGTRNIIVHGYTTTPTTTPNKAEVFLRINESFYEVGCCNGEDYKAKTPINSNEWVHLAGVCAYDKAVKQWRWSLYVNGILMNSSALAPVGAIPVNADWAIARHPDKAEHYFQGSIDEVRIWKRSRTAEAINADRLRRLSGNETDLVGYWQFEAMNGTTAFDSSRYEGHGTGMGKPTPVESPIPAYQVFAGTGTQAIASLERIQAGNWNHAAMVFNQSYGVQLSGTVNAAAQARDYLDCGTDTTLNLSGDLTLELFLQPENLGQQQNLLSRSQQQVLLSRGYFNSGTDQRTPYALYLEPENKLTFAFENVNGEKKLYQSESDSHLSQFCRIAVTRKQERRVDQTGTNASVTAWHEIRFYVNQEQLGEVQKYEAGSGKQPADIGSSSLPLTIGAAQGVAPFQGVLSEVRIWNRALPQASIGLDIKGGEQGLISWWRFEENEGSTAYDSKSNNHAKLQGQVQWVKDPNTNGSRLSLYLNGTLLNSQVADAASVMGGDHQFRMGNRTVNGAQQEFFQGELEEIRIWRVARTQEQIQDNLFRRLLGEKELLIAYYPFDWRESPDPALLSDYGLRGNDLKITADPSFNPYILSTAPISDDTPQVRSALAGIRTPFSAWTESTPAVQEYGDLQTDSDGNLTGVFKRCYSFIRNGQWHLITGFKVGNLVTEWVGQVQFAPQLIGFIEGAPPVPGENLTAKTADSGVNDYTGSSSVSLTEAKNATFTYSASKDKGFDMSVEASGGFLFKSKTAAGIGVATNIEENEGKVGIKASFEHSQNWLEDASTSNTRTTTKMSKLALRGRIDSDRFSPENVGFALVQSSTGDIFALRLEHNNALVSYQMRPNPDIPPDWNILTFPINATYTKQGTLDGKLGEATDPSYPNAGTYSPDRSYFKPIEAYSLKRQIQREEEQIRTFYDQWDAGGLGRRTAATQSSSGDLAVGRAIAKLPNIEKRNLVNTYVWTADGGLFAETQETLDVVQESMGGGYSFTGKAGVVASFEGVAFKIGTFFEMEALFGGHLNLTVTKGQSSETSFGVEVEVDGVESDVFERDDKGQIRLDYSRDPRNPKPKRKVGKVDAYRFMTFYLEPRPDSFEQFFNTVVDPIWLEQDSDPAAVALRQARQSAQQSNTKPPCWRVMHRVTYVSRVLAEIPGSNALPLDRKLKDINIDSNYELIKRLQPYVADKVEFYPDFARAVRDAVKEHLPELQPHTESILQFMVLYFGVDDTVAAPVDPLTLPDAARQPNRPPTVKAGSDGLVAAGVSLTLRGVVTDDRLAPEALLIFWSKVSGEGAVSFDQPNQPIAIASFSKAGRYVLRLTASDGFRTASDDVSVLVNEQPSISVGKPIALPPKGKTTLTGQVLSDGLGDRAQGNLQYQWHQIGGPVPATIVRTQALETGISFSKSGLYLMRLTVTNRTQGLELSSSADLEIDVATRVRKDLQVLYTFEGKSDTLVRDVSTVSGPLSLAITDLSSDKTALQWGISGLTLQKPARLVCTSVARMVDAIKSSSELTLEAWLTPAAVSASGLQRILTLSSGAAARNLILGQWGNQLQVGIRTSNTNANASDRTLTAGTLTATAPIHFVCTRNATGTTQMYINGAPIGSRVIDGDFSNWDSSFALVLGNELDSSDSATSWNGAFQLVALYSRALTPAEIQQNYDYGADTNLPPVVSVGASQTLNVPTLPATLPLTGAFVDDRPTTNLLSLRWTQADGPTAVTFSDPTSLTTSASFSEVGVYQLRLTVNDGEMAAGSDITVTVNQAPVIDLPQQQITNLQDGLALNPSVKSGRADKNDAALKATWQQVSSSGVATFSSVSMLKPTVTFSGAGQYTLRLTVDNGFLSSSKEFTVTVNQVPKIQVNANPVVTLPGTATLSGTVVDSGMGDPSSKLTVQWKQVSGAAIALSSADQLQSTVTFQQNGRYEFELSVSNGSLSASQRVVVTANEAPRVFAGADQKITLPVLAELDATVSDDGLPVTPGKLTLVWTQVSGPGTVTFSDPASDYTTARFSSSGLYVLRLTANDGAAETFSSLNVEVNQLPTVNAGGDRRLFLPATVGGSASPVTATLTGTVQDDSLPTPATLSAVWQQISGPTVALSNTTLTSGSASTTATFTQAGEYGLRLTANDGAGAVNSDIKVVVAPRTVRGLQTLYLLDAGRGSVVQDTAQAAAAPPLNLTADATTPLLWATGTRGIVLNQRSLIQSATPAAALLEALMTANAITLEAWIKPASNDAVSPDRRGRILSLAGSLSTRNFQLGVQPGAGATQTFMARVRTTTAADDTPQAELVGGTVEFGKPTHVVFTRDRQGIAILYLNGKEVSRKNIGGTFRSSWDATYRLAVGNEVSGDRPYLGEINLIAFYAAALTQDEVQLNFRSGF